MRFTFKNFLTFLICLLPPALCSLTGAFFRPGLWYQDLIKPAWTPPGFVFPIAWTILYLFMGVTLFHLWNSQKLKGKESFLYGMQFVFNGAWSPLFFGAHQIGKGLVVLFLLWNTILCFLYLIKKNSLLFGLNLIYFLWLTYALSLNGAIYLMNP